MSTRRFSLIFAGLLWLAVALRIGSRGITWLQPYFAKPDWHLALLAVSILIGLGKALTVLRKAVNRNLNNLENIDDNPINYLIGWLKLFGIRGAVMISLMIGIGIGLRYLREYHNADPYNIFGFIYLGIALGLGFGSIFYFRAVKTA